MTNKEILKGLEFRMDRLKESWNGFIKEGLIFSADKVKIQLDEVRFIYEWIKD